MKTLIQSSLVITAFCVGLFFCNHVALSSITFIAVVFNIGSLIKDRKELKRASFYCRTKSTIAQHVLSFLMVLPILAFVFLFLQKNPELIISAEANLYFFGIVILNGIGSLYQNFTNSVRSFDTGIVLPTFRRKLIEWSEIEAIRFEETKLSIDLNTQITMSFQIDKRDFADVQNIVNQFQQKRPR